MDEGRNMILLFPSLVRFAGEEERRRFGARWVPFLFRFFSFSMFFYGCYLGGVAGWTGYSADTCALFIGAICFMSREWWTSRMDCQSGRACRGQVS